MGVGLAMISMLTMLPGAADDLRAQLVLAAHPARRRDRRRRDARLLAPRRRPRRPPAARGLGHRHGRAAACSPPTSSTSTPGSRAATRSAARSSPSRARRSSSRNFPAGSSAPTDVIVPDASKAPAVARGAPAAARPRQPGRAARSRARRARASRVVLRGDPYATTTLDQVPELRAIAKRAGGEDVLVGGPTRAGVRPAPVRDARQPGDHPDHAGRRVPDPRRACCARCSRRCCSCCR